jgi:hypothetical protein
MLGLLAVGITYEWRDKGCVQWTFVGCLTIKDAPVVNCMVISQMSRFARTHRGATGYQAVCCLCDENTTIRRERDDPSFPAIPLPIRRFARAGRLRILKQPSKSGLKRAVGGLSVSAMEGQQDVGTWSLSPYSLSPRSSSLQLARLRELMADYELDGYLIVDSKFHYAFNGQYRIDQRVSFITQTDVRPNLLHDELIITQAQCGVVLVGKEKAAFKPDNSHILMADLQKDENWEILEESTSIESWAKLEIKGNIGYDPLLTPISTTPFWLLLMKVYMINWQSL